MYVSDVEKTEETDSVEKPKSIHGSPLGKVAVPKQWTSSNVTPFGWEGHMYCCEQYQHYSLPANWTGSDSHCQIWHRSTRHVTQIEIKL